MTYPTIAAGQVPDPADFAAMRPVYVYKAAATSRTSTITVSDDPDLIFTLAASAKYFVEFFLFYGGNTGKIRTVWRVPSGATGNRSVMGPGSTTTDANNDNITMRSGVFPFATAITYGTRNTTNLSIAVETALVTTTTAGTLALQWAQGTSDANATAMGSGAWGRARRLA